jgi:methionyl-tRNA synthetase
MTNQISINDFTKLDLRVAEIKSAEKVPETDKLLKLTIDLGIETREIVAGIAEHYKPEELIGKKIIVLINLEPRTIRGIKSNGMLLAAQNNDKLSLLTVDRDIDNGAKIS